MLKTSRNGDVKRPKLSSMIFLMGVACLILTRRCRQMPLVLCLAVFAVSCSRTQLPSVGQSGTNIFQAVTIYNLEPRRDVTGGIIDAHDGCLQFFEGRFYLYGTAYGNSDGYDFTNHYRVYSSPDLGRWTFAGKLLKDQPAGVYYRPYVVFNPNTRKYVLWYNWYPKLWEGRVGVAISDTPAGPFTVVNSNLNITGYRPGETNLLGSRPGDGSLFVDEDGTGYYVFSSIGDKHAVRVVRLNSNYLGPVGRTSDALATDAEAPVLFRRNNLYYVLCGQCCAFCPEGGQVHVFTSTSPLGPYEPRSNINRRTDDTNAPIIAAQQTWVAKIPLRGGPVFLWIGDRWGSAPDGIKGHDFQFWSAPLEFKPDGDIQPLKPVGRWDIVW